MFVSLSFGLAEIRFAICLKGGICGKPKGFVKLARGGEMNYTYIYILYSLMKSLSKLVEKNELSESGSSLPGKAHEKPGQEVPKYGQGEELGSKLPCLSTEL